MAIIDLRRNPAQEMQMYQQVGQSLGMAVAGARKLAVESKLTSIMANKDLTDQQRLDKIKEAGGLWYVTGRDVQEYYQRPEVKQQFMQSNVGQGVYQQDYQAQAKQKMASMGEALQLKQMLSSDQYRDAKTGQLTPEAQAMSELINQQLQSYMPQAQLSTVDTTQPTVASEKAAQELTQAQLGTQQKQQQIEQQQYEVSQRPKTETARDLDIEAKTLENQYKSGQIEDIQYQKGQRAVSERRAELENKSLEAKIAEIDTKASANGKLENKDKMEAEMSLRKEYNSNKTVQAYNVVRTYKNVVEEAAKRLEKGERLAADETIIVGLKKIIEPDSVVRESEYARTPESVGLLDSLRGRLEKITDGGSGIPAGKLEEIRSLVKQIETIHRDAYETAKKPYFDSARAYGLDEKLIFSDFSEYKSGPQKVSSEEVNSLLNSNPEPIAKPKSMSIDEMYGDK